LRAHQIPEFIYHESLSTDEVEAWLHQGEEFGPSWQKLFVRVSMMFIFSSTFFSILCNTVTLMCDRVLILTLFTYFSCRFC